MNEKIPVLFDAVRQTVMMPTTIDRIVNTINAHTGFKDESLDCSKETLTKQRDGLE